MGILGRRVPQKTVMPTETHARHTATGDRVTSGAIDKVSVMSAEPAASADPSFEQLTEELVGLRGDPLGFVHFAFPWGEPGELAKSLGPEPWQEQFLRDLCEYGPQKALLEATSSGHGVGKSCLVAWIILWAISTATDTRGIVTANTETQLKTKTWAELAKWFRLFVGKQFFRLEASGIFSREPDHAKTWRIDVVPWSERTTEAFAGLHNQGRRILVLFDEASAIPDAIWETTQGALTDSNTEIVWAVFGNPTRNDGRFKQCFAGGLFAHRWRSRTVDSREVSFTDKAQIARWISDYGDDDDFVRVRVKGTFPRIGNLQFIDSSVAAEAAGRDVETFNHDPLVVGVDVARFGDDASVFYTRRGRDGRTIAPQVFRGMDTMGLAARLAEHVMAHRPDAVFVDGGGVGGGVIDRCRQLGVMVFEVQFGSRPDRPDVSAEQNRYANKRAEIWGLMREWLRVGAIPVDQELAAQLTQSQYGFNARDEIQLESKTDLRRRGAGSPDMADALALTFAWPVMPRELERGERGRAAFAEMEYDPFAEEAA